MNIYSDISFTFKAHKHLKNDFDVKQYKDTNQNKSTYFI
jgi:hypothetical protein